MSLTGDILAGILEVSVDYYISLLTKTLITLLEKDCFPNQLESVEVTPVLGFSPTHPRYLKEDL